MDKKDVEIDIELFPQREVKVGRGTGERYSKYSDGIKRPGTMKDGLSIIEWTTEKIIESDDQHIRIPLERLMEKAGMHLKHRRDEDGKQKQAAFWGFKYAFYWEDVWIRQGQLIHGETPILDLRRREDTDRLPPSLRFESDADKLIHSRFVAIKARNTKKHTAESNEIASREQEQANRAELWIANYEAKTLPNKFVARQAHAVIDEPAQEEPVKAEENSDQPELGTVSKAEEPAQQETEAAQ